MIRVVTFLAAVALLAGAAAWLADRPGDVVITWLGYRIETSVGVLMVALVATAAGAVLLWALSRALVGAPGRLFAYWRRRRAAQGFRAITRGLVAIGAGDVQVARRCAEEAQRKAGNEPLTWLLAAQAAQLSGDHRAAEDIFRLMASRDDTRLLGLHGLFIEAQRQHDRWAARAAAEEAMQVKPALAWAARAVLELRCAEGDWAGALTALDNNVKAKLLDKASYRRQRAVLLTARALSGEDRESAKAHVLEAVKLAPGLVPAAALAGRLLAEAGETRKASRIIEAAWRISPHPDLAAVYAHVRPGDSARERLARVQMLARLRNDGLEAALAVARAAIDAHEFGIARASLAPFLTKPTQRVALLMAEIEEKDTGDIGRAREWMARALHAPRDPAWTADGIVSEKWLPVSPVSGRLDAFEWKVPVAELRDGKTATIEEPSPAPQGAVPAAPEPAPEPAPAPVRATAPEPQQVSLSNPSAQAAPAPLPVMENVIPLMHSPDDPGPEPGPEIEPEPPRGWRRLRALFW